MDDYFDDAAAAMADELGSVEVELRRTSTLRDARQDTPQLVAAAAAVAGASSLSVQAADGRPLHGDVPAGLVVGVPGGSATTAADVRLAQPAASFALAVSPLPVGVAQGAPLDFAPYVTRTVGSCLLYAVQERSAPRDLTPQDSFMVSIPKSLLAVAPRVGDVVLSPGGTGTVLARPDEGGGSWDVMVGRGSGMVAA